MAVNEFALLGLARVQEIFDDVVDNREVPGELIFRRRANKNEALDSEIRAKFQRVGHIPDRVMDDQQAHTYQAARMKFDTTSIPNIKQGRQLLQSDIKLLESLGNIQTTVQSNAYEEYFFNIAETLIGDMEMREEQMLVAMELGAWTYTRGDVIISIDYGMPTDLKSTVVVAWSNVATATPLKNIMDMARIRQVKYGRRTNRVKMSTPAFVLMVATDEFKNQAQRLFQLATNPAPQLPYQTQTELQNLAGRLLNMTIELIDHRYPTHQDNGSTPILATYMPVNKVILDSTDNDNNDRTHDFAIGIVTESIVDEMLGGWSYGLTGESFGPVTYITPTTFNLNPPGVVFWGVERGMPRKRDDAMTAVLDVGTVTDIIPVGIPF